MTRHNLGWAHTILARWANRPFEMVIMFLLFTEALQFLLATQPAPATVNVFFPLWVQYVWGFELALGTLLVGYGITFTEARTYKAGMVLVAAIAAFYIVSLAAYFHKVPGVPLQLAGDAALFLAAIVRARAGHRALR